MLNNLTNLIIKLPSGVCIIKVRLRYYKKTVETVSNILALRNSNLLTFQILV